MGHRGAKSRREGAFAEQYVPAQPVEERKEWGRILTKSALECRVKGASWREPSPEDLEANRDWIERQLRSNSAA